MDDEASFPEDEGTTLDNSGQRRTKEKLLIANYPKPGLYGFHFPLKALDDVEVAVRTTAAVLILASFCLYTDTEDLPDKFPVCFLMMVVAVALSMVPFVGAIISHGLSWGLGSLLAAIAAMIVINILGTDTETGYRTVNVQKCILPPIYVPSNFTVPGNITIPPFNTTFIPVDVPGLVGDPSPYGYAVLIFVGTFFFSYVADSKFFLLGSTISFNFYLALWYTGMKDPLRTEIDEIDFLTYTRTTCIGIGITLGCFLLPLPRILPTFVPQPRLSSSLTFLQLAAVAKTTSKTLNDLISIAVSCNERKYVMNDQRLVIIERILSENFALLSKLEKLMAFSTRYEPVWFPTPILRCTTVKNVAKSIRLYKKLIIYQMAMVQALNEYTLKKKPIENLRTFPPKIIELFEAVGEHIQNTIGSPHIHGSPFCCFYSKNKESEQTWQQFEADFEAATNSCFNSFQNRLSQYSLGKNESEVAFNEKHMKVLMTVGFQTYFMFCLYGSSLIYRRIENLRILPEDQSKWKSILLVIIDWPLNLLFWVISYFKAPYYSIKEVIQVLYCGNSKYKTKTMKRLVKHHYARLGACLLISLAAFISQLFVLVDDWRERLPTNTTIVLTCVAIIDRDQPSGGFRNAIYRLAGTTIGVAAAYLIVIFFHDDLTKPLSDTTIMLSLLVYILVARFFMQNPAYMILSYSFMVTVIVLFFGTAPDSASTAIVQLSALRAVAVGIGITIGSLCMVIWPFSARIRLRNTISKVIRTSRKILKYAFIPQKTARNKKKVGKYIGEIRELTFLQELLAECSQFEPDIFATPFPVHDYYNFLHYQYCLMKDAMITYELLTIETPNHDSRKEIPGVHVERLGQLLSKTLKSLCHKISSNSSMEHFEASLTKLVGEFLENTPSLDSIATGDKRDVIRMCSLLQNFYFMIQDLKACYHMSNRLVAGVVASTPLGIPFKVSCYKEMEEEKED